jgi:small subunit ribosomal protein S20e
MADKDQKKEGLEDQEIKRTRITFSGNKLNGVQQVTNQLVGNAKAGSIKISGPVRLPNKHLRICCRRSPCGEGSKTWDNYEMTIFKRYIDLECTSAQMKEVTSITIPNGVEINVDFRSAA